MHFDLMPWLTWLPLAVLGGWIGSFLAFRKDERALQVEQITKERTKWREGMRALCEDIVDAHIMVSKEKIAVNRSRLVTSLNPKDTYDAEIVAHYDALFDGSNVDIDRFTSRIAILLKHDWERVKWECMPLYLKAFKRWTRPQRAWRKKDYRRVVGSVDNGQPGACGGGRPKCAR
jgi:hypothetical protein